MSYNAILEILLHIDKIHAIDCYGGGLFKLRFSLYYYDEVHDSKSGNYVKQVRF